MRLLRLRRKNVINASGRFQGDRIETRSVAFVQSPTVLLKHSTTNVSRHIDYYWRLTASIEVHKSWSAYQSDILSINFESELLWLRWKERFRRVLVTIDWCGRRYFVQCGKCCCKADNRLRYYSELNPSHVMTRLRNILVGIAFTPLSLARFYRTKANVSDRQLIGIWDACIVS